MSASAAEFKVTNTNDAGFGSLRRAIDQANATPNSATPDRIVFSIPGGGVHTVRLASALAEISDPVVIDGWSQPGWSGAPLIELTAGADVLIDGLTITGGSSIVRGLVLNNFGSAVRILTTGNNSIQGCYIGTDATGALAVPNDNGIYSDRTSNNVIGGTSAAARNVISGNRQGGIFLDDSTQYDPATGGHIIQGNYIGTDAGGTRAVPNCTSVNDVNSASAAVAVWGTSTTIGGASAGAGNLVSGNSARGIWEYGSGVKIVGNIVGTDASGSVALPNTGTGISIQSYGGRIGSTAPGEGNLVSGNARFGIGVASAYGIIQGNNVGTSIDGTRGIPNGSGGIVISGSDTVVGPGNLVSANHGPGIALTSYSTFTPFGGAYTYPSNHTRISGNKIGTDVSGTVALPNTGDGIDAHAGESSYIGGRQRAAGNLISGNGGNGISAGAADTISGNLIGTQLDRTTLLGNTGAGVFLAQSRVTIGEPLGGTVEMANVIAYNGGSGVAVCDAGAKGLWRISGNSIHDNGGPGIYIDDVFANTGLKIQSAFGFNGSLTVSGTTVGAIGKPYTLEFFTNKSADPSGYGEGETFVGQASVTADINGNASFNVIFPLPPDAAFVTATQTDPNANTPATSSFAADVAIARAAPSPSPAPVTPATPPVHASQLLNISTRLQVGLGDHALIGGFIVTGFEAKKVIVRGIGPSLATSGLSGLLADPVLELHDASGRLVATNDDWKTDQRIEIESTGLSPSDDRESAIIQTLAPGNYTLILRGKGDGSGVGLVEAYDLSAGTDSRLGNISTRGFVSSGDNALIAGFIARGTGAGNAKVALRALGASLAAAGVTDALADPKLEVRNADGSIVTSNNDWSAVPSFDDPTHELIALGLTPVNEREAATTKDVPPGNYTVIVRANDNGTGVALVEVYDIGY